MRCVHRKRQQVSGGENPTCQLQEKQQKEKNQEEQKKKQIYRKITRSPQYRRDDPMKKQNTENEKDSDTHRQDTEKATSRKKVGEGAIKKRTQEEITTKPKIVEDKDTKEVEQRIGQRRDIKTGNTFSLLQEDDQEPILEEQLLPITKIDKEEKK